MTRTVAVVGATGQVGGVMRTLLAEGRLDFDGIRFFASSRSAGQALPFAGRSVVVEDVATADPAGIDIALLSIGQSASRQYAPRFAAKGAVVIDNSSAFRMDPEVPLVVPEVNPSDARRRPKGIIANPNCTTMIAVLPLKVIRDLFGLRRVIAATYQAASGAGRDGVTELAAQLATPGLAQLAFDPQAVTLGPVAKFPGPLGANVLPIAGELVDDETTEERKLRDESRKILGLPELAVSATCVRVPVFTGHSVALTVECEREPDLDLLSRTLAVAPGCRVDPMPTPLAATGIDPVLVGRLRRDRSAERSLALFVAGDNLRKGAALNAVQLAALVAQEG